MSNLHCRGVTGSLERQSLSWISQRLSPAAVTAIQRTYQ